MFPTDKPPVNEFVDQAKLLARSRAVRLKLPSWSAIISYAFGGKLQKTDCGPSRASGLTLLLSGETLTNSDGLAEVRLQDTMGCGDGTSIGDRLITDEVTFVATPRTDKPVFVTHTIEFYDFEPQGSGVFYPAVSAVVTVRTWTASGKNAPNTWVSWQAIVQNPGLNPDVLGG